MFQCIRALLDKPSNKQFKIDIVDEEREREREISKNKQVLALNVSKAVQFICNFSFYNFFDFFNEITKSKLKAIS